MLDWTCGPRSGASAATGHGARAQAGPVGRRTARPAGTAAASSCSHVPTCRPARRQGKEGQINNATGHVLGQRTQLSTLVERFKQLIKLVD